MISLPVLSPREVIRALERAGFHCAHRKGSHLTFRKKISPKKSLVVVVADHGEIPKGTLANILRQAHLTVDEFLAYL